jgi:3-hydroxyacyl-CoA dehydrogenase
MVPGFAPPAPFTYNLPGLSGLTAIKLALHDFAKKGVATPHDLVVGAGLGRILTGDGAEADQTLTEADLLRLERDIFVPLTKTKATQARVNHMLSKGKPLRN